MNKRIGQWLMGIILLWLVGCVPAISSEPAAIETAASTLLSAGVSIPTIPATATAVLPERPAPPLPGDPTPLP
ncbi:MAG: hypothetical protein M5U34_04000 [Chloroflexi bacterium]|nr:hypothetical protein [Chloroflexota bacterium]